MTAATHAAPQLDAAILLTVAAAAIALWLVVLPVELLSLLAR